MVGLTFLAIGLLIVTDQITILLLVVITFVMGIAFSFTGPTRQAYVGELVPPRKLANAVALSQLPFSLSRVIGPFVAGALLGVSFIGSGGTFLIMGSMFVIVLATLVRLPPSRRRGGAGASVREDLHAGLRHIRERPRLRLLVALFIVVVVVGFPYQTLLPAFLENELGRSARTVGMLLGASAGAGLVVGVALAGVVGGRWGRPLMLSLGLLFGASLLLLGAAPSFGLAFAVMLLVGAGSSGFQIINNALLMIETEPAYYGRVMSLTMLAWGGQGLAAFPLGVLADAIGERATLSALGAVVLAVVGVGAVASTAIGRREAALERSPAGGVEERPTR